MCICRVTEKLQEGFFVFIESLFVPGLVLSISHSGLGWMGRVMVPFVILA